MNLDSAYDHCRKLARHYENFPVGSILIPKKLRRHFYALYAFMRTADDFADIPTRPKEKRLALLADWRKRLDSLENDSNNPIFLALGNTIKECDLPIGPLLKLLEAFEFDAKGEVHFQTYEELHYYTSRSAEPVGELVLALFGYRDEGRIALSNGICTALQLLNFIQDRKEDLINERNYYPIEDSRKFASEKDLSLFELDRVEALIKSSTSLAESVRGRLRYELRAVILSARKMISKIRAVDGDTISVRPKLSKAEQIIILAKALVRKV